jgi:hypothetical protein
MVNGEDIERRGGSAALRSMVIPNQKDNLIPTVVPGETSGVAPPTH